MSFSPVTLSAYGGPATKFFCLWLCHLSVLATPAMAESACTIAQPNDSKTSDYLAPLINEAADRFAIPCNWIWAVMQRESAGHIRALSPKGAMGLMQIMPQTWHMLRQQYRLGADPYDPRDNIVAGAAYLREMHDRYGVNGFLAAYNAGPGRFDDHLKTGRPLPEETINYVATITRRLKLETGVDPIEMQKIASPHADLRLLKSNTSDLFPQRQRAFDNTDDAAPQRRHVTDLSALTASSVGIFVQTSAR